ncbi:MAG TPA: GNAT family N-acetyltransferase [Rhizomicrobium sp.]|jgi:CelD/BcsL family acetyltransferase involved in cellulose biosynthesis|nr:GNAT family N-acetyltransferase [Rhizomicrobium sp.]
MRWSTLKICDLTPAQVETWHQLHGQDAALRSPFTTYEFCRAVDKVRGNVFVSILESRSKIQAIFPFERTYGLIPGIARKPGGHLSDCFGIVGGLRHPLNEREILKATGLSVFSFDHLPLQENGLPVWHGIVSLGMRVEVPHFKDYVERLRKTNRKFVKEVERHTQQLVQQYGPMDFQWQAANTFVELERLIDRKRSQYLRSGCPDALKSLWARTLLSELLSMHDNNCEAVLSTLYCGDTWIASNLALRSGDLLHIWFPVFNRQLRRFGPGHVLFFKLFESAQNHDVQVFDFGGGDVPYKRKYAGKEYPLFKGSLRRFNLLSLAHRAAQSLSWKIGPLISR